MECDSKAMNKVAIKRGTCKEATAGCPDLLLETRNLLTCIKEAYLNTGLFCLYLYTCQGVCPQNAPIIYFSSINITMTRAMLCSAKVFSGLS